MALVPCRECKKETSTEAKACPACGAENPTGGSPNFAKAVWYIAAGFGFLLLLLIFYFFGFGSARATKATTDTQEMGSAVAVPSRTQLSPPVGPTQAPVVVEPPISLDGREQTVLTAILYEDLEYAVNGGNSVLLKHDIIRINSVTADAFQREYERNEAAADQRFRGREFMLRGTVAGVERGLGANYYITLIGGTNMFMRPQAHIAEGHTEFLSSLEKGDVVILGCRGGSKLMGSAHATACAPAGDYKEVGAPRIIDKLLNLANEDDYPSLRILARAIAVSVTLPDSSKCFTETGGMPCRKELTRATAQLKKHQELKPGIAQRLRVKPSVLDSVF